MIHLPGGGEENELVVQISVDLSDLEKTLESAGSLLDAFEARANRITEKAFSNTSALTKYSSGLQDIARNLDAIDARSKVLTNVSQGLSTVEQGLTRFTSIIKSTGTDIAKNLDDIDARTAAFVQYQLEAANRLASGPNVAGVLESGFRLNAGSGAAGFLGAGPNFNMGGNGAPGLVPYTGGGGVNQNYTANFGGGNVGGGGNFPGGGGPFNPNPGGSQQGQGQNPIISGAMLMGVGNRLTAGITDPLVKIGSGALDAASYMEKVTMQMQNMTKSSTLAKSILQDLINYGANTPFEIKGIIQAGTSILTFTRDAANVMPWLKTIGDAMAAQGKNTEDLINVTNAFDKMYVMTTVHTRELNQVMQRGVPALQYLASAFGVSTGEIRKLMQKNLIESSLAIPIIMRGMQRDFGGMADAAMETFAGMSSNIADRVFLTMAAIGSAILPAAKVVVGGITLILNAMRSMAEMFTELPQPVQNFVLIFATLAAATGPIVAAIGSVVLTLGLLGSLVGGSIATGVIALGAAFAGQAILIGGAISAVLALIVSFNDLSPTMKLVTAGLIAVGLYAVGLPLAMGVASKAVWGLSSALYGLITATIPNLISQAAVGIQAVYGIGTAGTATNAVLTRTGVILARFAGGIALAASAFAGWKLGEWMRNSSEEFKKFVDSIGEFLTKIPGVTALIQYLTGATGQVNAAMDMERGTVNKLEAALKSHGITMTQGTMTLSEYSAALRAKVATLNGDTVATINGALAAKRLQLEHASAVQAVKDTHAALLALQQAKKAGANVDAEIVTATNAYHEALMRANPTITKFGLSSTQLTAAKKAETKAHKEAEQAIKDYEEALKEFGLEATKKDLGDTTTKFNLLTAAYNSGKLGLADYRLAIQDYIGKLSELGTAGANAFKALDIKSVGELTAEYNKAYTAYKSVLDLFAIHKATADDVVAAQNKLKDSFKETHETMLLVRSTPLYGPLKADLNLLIPTQAFYLTQLEQMKEAYGDLGPLAEKIFGPTSTAQADSLLSVYKSMPLTLTGVGKALSDMKIKTSSDLKEEADTALKNYDIIRKAGTETPWVIAQAWVQAAEAQARLVHQQPQDIYDSYNKIKAYTQDVVATGARAFKDFGNQVSTIFNDFGRSVVDILIPKATKGTSALILLVNELGRSIARAFVETAARSLTTFLLGLINVKSVIENILHVLAKLPGIGGIFDKLHDILFQIPTLKLPPITAKVDTSGIEAKQTKQQETLDAILAKIGDTAKKADSCGCSTVGIGIGVKTGGSSSGPQLPQIGPTLGSCFMTGDGQTVCNTGGGFSIPGLSLPGLGGGSSQGPQGPQNAFGRGVSGFLSGAGTGAAIGSVIPGLGTVVGAAIGGVIGAVGGIFGGASTKGATPGEQQIINILGGNGATSIFGTTLASSQYLFDIRDRVESVRNAIFDPLTPRLEELIGIMKGKSSGSGQNVSISVAVTQGAGSDAIAQQIVDTLLRKGIVVR